MSRCNTARVALIATLLTAGVHSAHAAMVTIDPITSADNLLVGDRVTFTIKGSDFFNGTIGGAVNIDWNPLILEIAQLDTDVTLTYPNLSLGELKGTLDEAAGTLTGVGASGEVLNTSFDFAEITFTAIGNGTTPIDIELGTTSAGPLGWVEPDGTPIVPEYIDASATVVPLPAAAWLFVSSLVGLGVVGRRSSDKIT